MYKYTPKTLAEQLTQNRLAFRPQDTLVLDDETIAEGAEELLQALRRIDTNALELDVTKFSLIKLYEEITFIMEIVNKNPEDFTQMHAIFTRLKIRIMSTNPDQENADDSANPHQKYADDSAPTSTANVTEVSKTAHELLLAINKASGLLDNTTTIQEYLKSSILTLTVSQQVGMICVSGLFELAQAVTNFSSDPKVPDLMYKKSMAKVYKALEALQKAACVVPGNFTSQLEPHLAHQTDKRLTVVLTATAGTVGMQLAADEKQETTTNNADKKSTINEASFSNSAAQVQLHLYNEANKLLSPVFWLPIGGISHHQIDALQFGVLGNKIIVGENGNDLNLNQFIDAGVAFFSFKQANGTLWHLFETPSGYLAKRVEVTLSGVVASRHFHEAWVNFDSLNEFVAAPDTGITSNICCAPEQVGQLVQIYYEESRNYLGVVHFKAAASDELPFFKVTFGQAGTMLRGYYTKSMVKDIGKSADFFYGIITARCLAEGIYPNSDSNSSVVMMRGTLGLLTFSDDDAFILLRFSASEEDGSPKYAENYLINDDNVTQLLAELKNSADTFLITRASTSCPDNNFNQVHFSGSLTLNELCGVTEEGAFYVCDIEGDIQIPSDQIICPGGKLLHDSEWHNLATGFDIPIPIDALQAKLAANNIQSEPNPSNDETYTSVMGQLNEAKQEGSSNLTFVDNVEYSQIIFLRERIESSRKTAHARASTGDVSKVEDSKETSVPPTSMVGLKRFKIKKSVNNHTSWFQPDSAKQLPSSSLSQAGQTKTLTSTATPLSSESETSAATTQTASTSPTESTGASAPANVVSSTHSSHAGWFSN